MLENLFLSAPKASKQGFKARFPLKKPLLSKIHRERRLAFAKNYVNMQLSFWNKHLWIHESKFNFVKFNGAQKIRKKEGETYKLNCIRGTVKVGGCNVMV